MKQRYRERRTYKKGTIQKVKLVLSRKSRVVAEGMAIAGER